MVSDDIIRDILRQNEAMSPIVDSLGEDDDLFEKGLDSFGSVQLMLALEERFEVEFPDTLLNRRSFSTIRIIRETVTKLSMGAAA
ncbi:acyl carrier protein [Methylobacterium persicinum]|uniref:Acyl carrier protein n=1 Tax=Methylobacterium persicinum TaxID=374426 RepID=A0ABU0HHM6_9HYPH|nr:acyl carrier protein [Methylobacterium persicinum]MDQ0441833.1 acyl carrier protein [Methylobacterium persicinum]GJE38016.1 Aminoacyl carrier protein [Methylobacterium persicinum]